VSFAPAPRQRVKQAKFDLSKLEPVGATARGTRLSPKPVSRVKHEPRKPGPRKPGTRKTAAKKATSPKTADASPAAKKAAAKKPTATKSKAAPTAKKPPGPTKGGQGSLF